MVKNVGTASEKKRDVGRGQSQTENSSHARGERYKLRHKPNAPLGDVVTEPYALYFGLFADASSFGVLCSVYKARCCRSSGFGKRPVSLRNKRTKAAQQDLNNHILLCKTNGIGYVPRP